jgi:hypothetical protein
VSFAAGPQNAGSAGFLAVAGMAGRLARVSVWGFVVVFWGIVIAWAAGLLPVGLDPVFQKIDQTRVLMCFGQSGELIEVVFSDNGRVATLRFREINHRLARETGRLAPEDFYTSGSVSLLIDPEIVISGLTADQLRHCDWR